jgi:hypothetical protein
VIRGFERPSFYQVEAATAALSRCAPPVAWPAHAGALCRRRLGRRASETSPGPAGGRRSGAFLLPVLRRGGWGGRSIPIRAAPLRSRTSSSWPPVSALPGKVVLLSGVKEPYQVENPAGALASVAELGLWPGARRAPRPEQRDRAPAHSPAATRWPHRRHDHDAQQLLEAGHLPLESHGQAELTRS